MLLRALRASSDPAARGRAKRKLEAIGAVVEGKRKSYRDTPQQARFAALFKPLEDQVALGLATL